MGRGDHLWQGGGGGCAVKPGAQRGRGGPQGSRRRDRGEEQAQEHHTGPQRAGKQAGRRPNGQSVGGTAAALRAHGGMSRAPEGVERRAGLHIPCFRAQPTDRRPRVRGGGRSPLGAPGGDQRADFLQSKRTCCWILVLDLHRAATRETHELAGA